MKNKEGWCKSKLFLLQEAIQKFSNIHRILSMLGKFILKRDDKCLRNYKCAQENRSLIHFGISLSLYNRACPLTFLLLQPDLILFVNVTVHTTYMYMYTFFRYFFFSFVYRLLSCKVLKKLLANIYIYIYRVQY